MRHPKHWGLRLYLLAFLGTLMMVDIIFDVLVIFTSRQPGQRVNFVLYSFYQYFHTTKQVPVFGMVILGLIIGAFIMGIFRKNLRVLILVGAAALWFIACVYILQIFEKAPGWMVPAQV